MHYENGNKDVVIRILSMMEQMTEWIVKMEWTTKSMEHKKIIIRHWQTQKWDKNERVNLILKSKYL